MRSRQTTIGTRLTEVEYEKVHLAAQARGMTLSEWLRSLVLTQTAAPDLVFTTLVEEILALRIILQNLVIHLTTDGTQVRKETLAKVIELANQIKAERALGLISQAKTWGSPRR